jgi:hypothetical protein
VNSRATPQRTTADLRYLRESLETLERVDCQFWACKGPTLHPIPMTTCQVCSLIARLRRRLGLPIRQGIEGSYPISQDSYRRYIRECTR